MLYSSDKYHHTTMKYHHITSPDNFSLNFEAYQLFFKRKQTGVFFKANLLYGEFHSAEM
jgi:hypothetical protein